MEMLHKAKQKMDDRVSTEAAAAAKPARTVPQQTTERPMRMRERQKIQTMLRSQRLIDDDDGREEKMTLISGPAQQ